MKCLHCNEIIIQGQFVVLNGGALLVDGDNPDISRPDNQLDGFLNLFYHDDVQQTYKSADIQTHGPNGQFELYFCSKKCTSDWFSDIVNNLVVGVDL